MESSTQGRAKTSTTYVARMPSRPESCLVEYLGTLQGINQIPSSDCAGCISSFIDHRPESSDTHIEASEWLGQLFRSRASSFGGSRGRTAFRVALALVAVVFKKMMFVDVINDLYPLSVSVPTGQIVFALQRE